MKEVFITILNYRDDKVNIFKSAPSDDYELIIKEKYGLNFEQYTYLISETLNIEIE